MATFECNKIRFPNDNAAHIQIDFLNSQKIKNGKPIQELYTYKCPCGAWHITQKKNNKNKKEDRTEAIKIHYDQLLNNKTKEIIKLREEIKNLKEMLNLTHA